VANILLSIDVNDKGTAKVRQFQQAVAGSRGPMDQFGTQAKRMGASMDGVGHSATRLVGSLRTVYAAAIAAGAGFVGRELVRARLEFERFTSALTAVTGSAAIAGQEFAFIRSEANRLALDQNALAESYAKLTAATRETALQGEAARKIFVGFAEASAVLKLSADDTRGALRAIEQMISKGKVSAEELRQQLGERLPGAFNIAAKSIGVSTAELDKMLKQGEVLASDILPRMAEELHNTFGPGANKNVETLGGAINRFRNEMENLKRGTVGTAVTEFLRDTINGITLFLREGSLQMKLLWDRFWFGALETAYKIGHGIQSAVDFMVTAVKVSFLDMVDAATAAANQIQAQLNRILPQGMQFTIDPRQYRSANLISEQATRQARRDRELADTLQTLAAMREQEIGGIFQAAEDRQRAADAPTSIPAGMAAATAAIDPLIDKYNEMVKAMRDHNAVARLVYEGRQREAEILKVEQQLGAKLTDQQRAAVEVLLVEKERIEALTETRDKMIKARADELDQIEKNTAATRDYLSALQFEIELQRMRMEGRAEEAEILKAQRDSGALRGSSEAQLVADLTREKIRLGAEEERLNGFRADAAAALERTITAEERRAVAIQQATDALAFGIYTADEYNRVIESINAETSKAGELAKNLGFEFASAFEDAIIGGKGLREVLQGLLRDIARIALREGVTAPVGRAIGNLFTTAFAGLGGGGAGLAGATTYTAGADAFLFPGIGSARGNIFGWGHDGAGLIEHAMGGILNRSIAFPMGGGRVGTAAESNTEAIMPVARDAQGRLGVYAAGGRDTDVVVNVINNTGEKTERRESTGPNGEQLIEIIIGKVSSDIERGGRVGQSISSAFGLSRAAGSR
jgi:tape measure domain-containing protein